MSESIEGKAILKNNFDTGSMMDVTVFLSNNSVIIPGMAHDVSVSVNITHENGETDMYFVVYSYTGKNGDVFENGSVYTVLVSPPIKPSDKMSVKAYLSYKLTS